MVEPLRIISLGAGVQSTTMALMAAKGELGPMPDAAIFADTGDEPQPVYDHLAWLSSGVLPFPVHVTGRGRISADVMGGDKQARPPLFVPGSGQMGRQCTRNYKLRPIRAKIRKLLGVGPQAKLRPGAVEVWIGISLDEVIRMKPSGLAYLENRHPLIEARLSRQDCKAWLTRNGFAIPPKSSCWHCPYQTNTQWRERRDERPEEWAQAVAFDKALRSPEIVALYGAAGFVHPSKQPLDEVDLSTLADYGQLDMFLNDCEGMCGV